MTCRLWSACLFTAVLGASEPALIHPGAIEFHGTLKGQPFWAKLLPADRQFGGNRVLQLVYTPPAAGEMGGAALVDHPFILLDAQARVVAWNGRESLTQAVPDGGGKAYRVQRELDLGATEVVQSDARVVTPGRAWDLQVAPLLLALTWKAAGQVDVPVVDLFGPRHAETLTAAWTGTAATVAGMAYVVSADAQGLLAGLNAADGSPILTVAAITLAPEATP